MSRDDHACIVRCAGCGGAVRIPRTLAPVRAACPRCRQPTAWAPVRDPPTHEEFVAIDFETADRGRDSACAVAVVRVRGVEVVERWTALIRPPRRRFEFTHIHGLTWDDVRASPTFADLWPALRERLSGVEFVAAHNAPFDRSVLNRCCDAAGFEPPLIEYVDTVKVARNVWGIFPTKLPMVCEFLSIPLDHHDAGSDAEACARIVVEAVRVGLGRME